MNTVYNPESKFDLGHREETDNLVGCEFTAPLTDDVVEYLRGRIQAI